MRRATGRNPNSAASASLAWGIAGLGAWLVPPVGLLVALTGLYLAHRGRDAADGDRARLGMVLSTVALVLSAWFSAWIVVAGDNPNF